MNPVIITLSNGKRVANFSSPHAFEFEDGSILPAVSNEDAEKYKVNFIEEEFVFGDIELSFSLSNEVFERMKIFENLYAKGELDVCFVAMPMLVALKDTYNWTRAYIQTNPFRCIRIEDRIKKLVSIHKQCI